MTLEWLNFAFNRGKVQLSQWIKRWIEGLLRLIQIAYNVSCCNYTTYNNSIKLFIYSPSQIISRFIALFCGHSLSKEEDNNLTLIKSRNYILTALILAIFLCLPSCQHKLAYGDDSIAIKLGYYDYTGGGAQYNSQDGFDSEIGLGAYYKRSYPNWFIRLDWDRLKTGNEFSNNLSIPYEAVDLKQDLIGLSICKKANLFYAGGGIDYSFNNRSFIELYPHQTDTVQINNSLGYHILIGLSKPFTRYWSYFVEGKAFYSKVEVEVNGVISGKEDIGHYGIITGLEWKW